MKPLLCIVSVYRPDLLRHAQHAFTEVDDVRVVLDRRVGERRNPERANSEAVRHTDRRRISVDERLLAHGYAFIEPSVSREVG